MIKCFLYLFPPVPKPSWVEGLGMRLGEEGLHGYEVVSRASLTSKESESGRLRHTSVPACQNLGRANENGVLNHACD